MNGVVINLVRADVERINVRLDQFGITPYVHVGQPWGAYCGATLLFQLRPNATLSPDATALMLSTRERFDRDRHFRSAVSFYCFQLGAYVQNWNGPAPDLNFEPPSFMLGGAT